MPKKVTRPAPKQELSQSLLDEGSAAVPCDVAADVPGDVPDDVPADVSADVSADVPGDVPAAEVVDDTDVTDAEDVVIVKDVAGSSKKRIRPSKKDIKDYPFTDEQLREIASYVQSHPELYDKGNEKWLNPAWKLSLWEELAHRFNNCTYQQVKKLVDKKRTDFGKIEKRENKSGSAARPRTPREQRVMDVWGFLSGHIAHEKTHPSEDFGKHRYDPESSSHESGLSAHSLARRKRKKERHDDDVSSQLSTKGSPERSTIKQLLESAKLLATQKPPLEGPEKDVNKFVEYLQTRLLKVSPINHGVLFAKLNSIISLMEEPVPGRTAIKEPRRLLESLPNTVGVAGPSHQWQPPAPPTVAAAPPPTLVPQLYQQTQYQQAQYAPNPYLQPQYQPPQQQQYQQPPPQQQFQQPPPQQQYQQAQQSEQQQFPQHLQQQVGTPQIMDTIISLSSSPIRTRLQPLKARSPAKKGNIGSPMLHTPRVFEQDDLDD